MSRIKNTGRELLFETAGSVLIAFGICNFAAAAQFPMTGFSGIALIFYRLFHMPIGLTQVLLNVPLALLCGKLLGGRFLLRSVRCILINSFFIDIVAPLFPLYRGSRLIAALCTGVLCGLGYALIYMVNSSTGGTDFIIMSVRALRPYLSVGRIAFLCDLLIVGAGGLLFRDMDGVVYGLIVSFLMAVVVDKVLYGVNAGKVALVVTDRGKQVCDAIDACCGRGSTILKAAGGYREDEKQVVMCACDNKQMIFVQKTIQQVDPRAFLVVLDSSEVHGEGFRMVSPGQPE